MREDLACAGPRPCVCLITRARVRVPRACVQPDRARGRAAANIFPSRVSIYACVYVGRKLWSGLSRVNVRASERAGVRAHGSLCTGSVATSVIIWVTHTCLSTNANPDHRLREEQRRSTGTTPQEIRGPFGFWLLAPGRTNIAPIPSASNLFATWNNWLSRWMLGGLVNNYRLRSRVSPLQLAAEFCSVPLRVIRFGRVWVAFCGRDGVYGDSVEYGVRCLLRLEMNQVLCGLLGAATVLRFGEGMVVVGRSCLLLFRGGCSWGGKFDIS